MKKKSNEDELLKQYLEEDAASKVATAAMKERIDAHKKEVDSKKKEREDEIMKKYLEEERLAEEASRDMKERIAKHKKRTGLSQKRPRR